MSAEYGAMPPAPAADAAMSLGAGFVIGVGAVIWAHLA